MTRRPHPATATRARTRTRALSAAAALALTAGLVAGTASGPATAAQPNAQPNAQPGKAYPAQFSLPDGFQPEGIAIGPNKKAYFGSRLDGDIYKVNLVNGKGRVISEGPGTPSVGLKSDVEGRLFVSGGTAGNARVVDGRTGEVLKRYRFVDGPAGASFINDVVLTDDAAYFTDSLNAQLFKLPLGEDGRLPKRSEVETIALSGAWRQQEGNNANGLTETPDGKALLVVNSANGKLFRVDPDTGKARKVDLGDTLLPNGDGMLLTGQRLYVVQNRLNQVAVLKINRDGRSGRGTRTLTSPAFDVPTTIARLNGRLYLPNARFSTPPTPATTYTVNQIPVP